jgi:hypothetical protein
MVIDAADEAGLAATSDCRSADAVDAVGAARGMAAAE